MSTFEFSADGTISAFDAGFDPETFTDGGPQPEVADPKGPNRFTILVPTEHVTVNMGEAVFPATGTADGMGPGEALVDPGFVVQTDRHVHFHAFGYSASDDKWAEDQRTFIRLGTPSSVVTAVASSSGAPTSLNGSVTDALIPLDVNSLQTPSKLWSAYAEPFNAWDGYAMITQGSSYQESVGNNIIASGKADVRIAGQRSVIIGSPGDVHIVAHGSAITDVASNLDPNVYPTSLPANQQQGVWLSENNFCTTLGVVTASVTAAVGVFQIGWILWGMKYSRPARPGAPGWQYFLEGAGGGFLAKAGDMVGFLGAWAGPVSAGIGLGMAIAAVNKKPSDPPGQNVTLFAEGSFSAFGKSTASVTGGISASVHGEVVASLTGNVAASVSALVVSISGLATASMTSMGSVSMGSTLGSATVSALQSVQLSSWGKVFVAGNEDVQITSMDKNVYIHGNTGFYIGAGSGTKKPRGFMDAGSEYAPAPGFGIIGLTDRLILGKMKTANVWSKEPDPANPSTLPTGPQPDAQTEVLIRENMISLTAGNNLLIVDAGGLSLNGKKIQFG